MVLALHNAYKIAKDIVETSEKDAGKLADEAIATFRRQAAAGDGISASDAKILLDIMTMSEYNANYVPIRPDIAGPV